MISLISIEKGDTYLIFFEQESDFINFEEEKELFVEFLHSASNISAKIKTKLTHASDKLMLSFDLRAGPVPDNKRIRGGWLTIGSKIWGDFRKKGLSYTIKRNKTSFVFIDARNLEDVLEEYKKLFLEFVKNKKNKTRST